LLRKRKMFKKRLQADAFGHILYLAIDLYAHITR
jgi:hypothetical protein